MAGICYQCGRRLVNALGKPVEGETRAIDGNPVRLHKVCAKTFDADQRREVTVTPTFRDTTENNNG